MVSIVHHINAVSDRTSAALPALWRPGTGGSVMATGAVPTMGAACMLEECQCQQGAPVANAG